MEGSVERRRVDIDYAPRQQFLTFHERRERWAILVAHRRAGKTVACINELIAKAIRCERAEGRFAYIAPHFNQAKDTAWTYLKRYAAPLLAETPNESELRVDLLNGARVRLYGADNPDRLRGPYFDGVVLDEFADMRPSLWREVVRPMLSDRLGWAAFIGTPKGKNAFWDLWVAGQKDPEWFTLLLKASASGILLQSELDSARGDMGEDQYLQEFECSFEAAITGAFYAEQLRRMEAEGRLCHLDIDRGVRVHTAWDLGVSDSTAIWFIQCVARERRMVDYYETSGVGLNHYVDVLADKRRERNWIYADHYFPHDIANRELSSGQSRVETLRSLGIEAQVVRQHNPLDGINAVRRMLDRSWIDPVRCERGLEALRQYQREWDDRLKDWKSNPLHNWASHGADAARTFAAGFDDPVGVRKTDDRLHRWRKGGQPSHWAS